MSARTQQLKRFLSLALLLAALVACGQGGTEVGNPNQPSGGAMPNSGDVEGTPAAPSLEGPTPTPSPQSFLIEETQEGVQGPEEDGALINPEET